jgi:hypothetical protein
MMNTIRFVVSLALMIGASNSIAIAQRDTPPNVQHAEAARTAVVEWLECEECEEGQLSAVLSYGKDVVPLLRASLLHGASPASRELLRRELIRRYDELRQYQETHADAKLASTRGEFVASNLANLDAQYRVRAAKALGAIGGSAARSALREASKQKNRADVKASIQAALKISKR